jgi:pyruvate/2-oxoglutarate dehydrogenase complex dihydrolipoamide acyltransferase (E2) component
MDGATAAGGRSCCLSSRAIDGARGAQFLGALVDLVEEPLALLT